MVMPIALAGASPTTALLVVYSIDLVLNVESSHCYPDIARFYSEVHRILCPGGFFLYADLYSPDKVPGLQQKIQDAGFTIVKQEDMTVNVALAIRRCFALVF